MVHGTPRCTRHGVADVLDGFRTSGLGIYGAGALGDILAGGVFGSLDVVVWRDVGVLSGVGCMSDSWWWRVGIVGNEYYVG